MKRLPTILLVEDDANDVFFLRYAFEDASRCLRFLIQFLQ